MALNDLDKRVRYFPGQYLLEEDFEHEQNYHRDRLQRINRQLHVSGITDGLNVIPADGLTVNITKGDAIDDQGRQIVLLSDTSFNIKDGTSGTLYVRYPTEAETEPTDLQETGNKDTGRRLHEQPIFSLVPATGAETEAKPEGAIALAKLTIQNNKIATPIDETVRQYSGLRLPSADAANAPTLRSGGNSNPSLAVLQGSLSITGNTMVNGTLTVANTSTLSGKLTVNSQVELNGAVGKTGLTINSEGKVGIGTIGPKSLLSVAGGVAIGSGYATAVNAALDGQLIIQNKLGIGTQSPGASSLAISSPDYFSGGILKMQTKLNPDLYFLEFNASSTGNNVVKWSFKQKNNVDTYSDILTFDRGKIGIGTASPQSMLSVAGGVAIGSSYATGNNTASDGQLIVQEQVSIGPNVPQSDALLDVQGTAIVYSLQIRSPNYWTPLNMGDSYWKANDENNNYVASFCKDSLGMVHLRGVIARDCGMVGNPRENKRNEDIQSNVSIAYLSTGYRPSKKMVFSVVTNFALLIINISGSGEISLTDSSRAQWNTLGGQGRWLSLDGISFDSAP